MKPKCWIVYARDNNDRIGFTTKKQAEAWVGTATGSFEIRPYCFLTKFQAETLFLVDAVDFELKLRYASSITKHTIRGE